MAWERVKTSELRSAQACWPKGRACLSQKIAYFARFLESAKACGTLLHLYGLTQQANLCYRMNIALLYAMHKRYFGAYYGD
jgi:hypothetical protein